MTSRYIRPDGSVVGITFSKASGRRSSSVNVSTGRARLTLSIDGVDFHTQWERAAQFLIDEQAITDEHAQQQIRGAGEKFLAHYGLKLKLVQMYVIDKEN